MYPVPGTQVPRIVMVEYQTWIEVAFEVAIRKGLDTARPSQSRLASGGRSFSENNENARAMQAFARMWNRNKDKISAMTRAEARNFADREILIR